MHILLKDKLKLNSSLIAVKGKISHLIPFYKKTGTNKWK